MFSWITGAIDTVVDGLFESPSSSNARATRFEDAQQDSVVDLQVGRSVFEAPSHMRRELWLSLLHQHGGTGISSMQQFERYAEEHLSQEQEQEIQKDVGRTFPGHRYLGTRAGKLSMFRVLRAYAAYDPKIGYTQGMNFLAGLLLTYLTENEAFGALVMIMKDRGLRDLYDPDDGMALLQARLFQLGCLAPPDLTQHLEDHGVLPVLYASSWFLTCFAGDFPLHFAARVMDLIITDTYGFSTTMKVAVHILECCSRQLLEMNDMEDMVNLLRKEVPMWPRLQLQELLSGALGKGWSERQLKILEEVSDVETVAEAVARLEARAKVVWERPVTSSDPDNPALSNGMSKAEKSERRDGKNHEIRDTKEPEIKAADISITSDWTKDVDLDPTLSSALSTYMTNRCSIDPLLSCSEPKSRNTSKKMMLGVGSSHSSIRGNVPTTFLANADDAKSEEWEFTEYTGAEPLSIHPKVSDRHDANSVETENLDKTPRGCDPYTTLSTSDIISRGTRTPPQSCMSDSIASMGVAAPSPFMSSGIDKSLEDMFEGMEFQSAGPVASKDVLDAKERT